jgi:hypothetical protein
MTTTDRARAAARRARRCLISALTMASVVLAPVVAGAQAQTSFAPREENPEDLPEGPGREETFYSCTPCHNFKLVSQQGMTRRQWEESLSWMTEKHGMNPIEGDDRKLILDYLEKHFPPSEAPQGRGAPNPFLKR